jgi:fucose permease
LAARRQFEHDVVAEQSATECTGIDGCGSKPLLRVHLNSLTQTHLNLFHMDDITPKANRPSSGSTTTFQTRTPARMDRLPWSGFHRLVVVALGITWVLDGLEVTIKGAISGVLQEAGTLHLTSAQIGLIASSYLTGAVSGALFFGHLTDRLGRKKLFFVTLSV